MTIYCTVDFHHLNISDVSVRSDNIQLPQYKVLASQKKLSSWVNLPCDS